MECGADDAGLVHIERSELDDQRDELIRIFPRARTLLSFVCRMNREPIRNSARSLANLEFHHTGEQVNETGRKIVRALEDRGVRAINVTMGFPMEADRWPGTLWVLSHKPIAVAAGLGAIGIHRNVIHPRFGNFVLLGTVVIEAHTDEEAEALDYNPCLECKLCVAACPTGAIHPDGSFDFSACYTHNYREFMGGFVEWVEQIADSGSARAYRQRVKDHETVSWWQSLSFGANYKAAYCIAVCPAGEEVIGPWQADKRLYKEQVLKPLRNKEEEVYVVPGSDAERYVAKRFPNKSIRRVDNSLRPASIRGFVSALPHLFQKGAAGDLAARYHMVFYGREEVEVTVDIRDSKIDVQTGLVGQADLTLRADTDAWLGFLRKDHGLIGALLTRKVRLRGSIALLKAFGRCFP